MTSSSIAVPAAFAVLSFGMFFLAFSYRSKSDILRGKPELIGWFDAFYVYGNIFALACLNTVFGVLNTASVPFSSVVLPVFQLLIYCYLFVNIVIFLKFFKFLLTYSYSLISKKMGMR